MFVCHQNDVCEDSIGSVYVVGYCGLSESELCVFSKLCPVIFLVVCSDDGYVVSSLLLVPFMKQKLIMLCIMDPFTV